VQLAIHFDARPVHLCDGISRIAQQVDHRLLQQLRIYHFETFRRVLAAVLALLIAIITVSVHSLLVARANPARALRYD